MTFVSMIVKLFQGFNHDFDSWISLGINRVRRFFIRINHQVKMIYDGKKMIHPANISTGIKFGFNDIKTRRVGNTHFISLVRSFI
jgi:hypothetical protein